MYVLLPCSHPSIPQDPIYQIPRPFSSCPSATLLFLQQALLSPIYLPSINPSLPALPGISSRSIMRDSSNCHSRCSTNAQCLYLNFACTFPPAKLRNELPRHVPNLPYFLEYSCFSFPTAIPTSLQHLFSLALTPQATLDPLLFLEYSGKSPILQLNSQVPPLLQVPLKCALPRRFTLTSL